MRFFDELVNRTGILGELFGFFWSNKWWWLTPMLLILFVFGGLIVFRAKLCYRAVYLHAVLGGRTSNVIKILDPDTWRGLHRQPHGT
jgi:lipoprotein signal peptidase